MKSTESLFEVAARFRSYYIPMWALPIVLLIAQDTVLKLGSPFSAFFFIIAPLFFFCFFRSALPWLRKQVSYSHSVILSMVIPFLTFAVGVQVRLALIRHLGT